MRYTLCIFIVCVVSFVCKLPAALIDTTSTNKEAIVPANNSLLQLLVHSSTRDIANQIMEYLLYEETEDSLIARTQCFRQPGLNDPYIDNTCTIFVANKLETPYYRVPTVKKQSKIYESYEFKKQPWRSIPKYQIFRALPEKVIWEIPYGVKNNNQIKTTSFMKLTLMESIIPIDGIDSNLFAVSADRSKLAVVRVNKNANNQTLRQKSIWIYDRKTTQVRKFNLPTEYKRRLFEYPLETNVGINLHEQGYESFAVSHDHINKRLLMENFFKLLEISNNGKLMALADNKNIYLVDLRPNLPTFNVIKTIDVLGEPAAITPKHEFVSRFSHLSRALRFNKQATHLAVRLNHKQSGQETVEVIDLKNFVDKTFVAYCKEKGIVKNELHEAVNIISKIV